MDCSETPVKAVLYVNLSRVLQKTTHFASKDEKRFYTFILNGTIVHNSSFYMVSKQDVSVTMMACKNSLLTFLFTLM